LATPHANSRSVPGDAAQPLVAAGDCNFSAMRGTERARSAHGTEMSTAATQVRRAQPRTVGRGTKVKAVSGQETIGGEPLGCAAGEAPRSLTSRDDSLRA